MVTKKPTARPRKAAGAAGEAADGVTGAVAAVIAGLSESDRGAWLAELALTLARTMDAYPNAATAGQLRATMAELTATAVPKETSAVDDLVSRRAARRAAASGT